ncbi:hypothetical protein, partial [Lactobacillus crispatus]|uniref:hypothetical protein n=1 Tax=Lactobacillus crispatus TaxID=47770 RepID=UPI001414D676
IASRDVTVSPDDPDGRIISFQLEMSAADPPLMPAAGPAPPGTPTDAVGVTPAVLARLRQDPVTLTGPVGTASVYPLALLEDWPIERVIIETGVTHLPGATIRTRGGPVDATAPFLPFGAPARANAWFQIQHRELFAKPLDRLTVSIDWLGVPAHPRGFAGYYEQYVVGPDRTLEFSGIANTSF